MEHLLAANERSCNLNRREDPRPSQMYKCEGLFAEYLRKFHVGPGQMKSVLLETDRTAKPSVVLFAPSVYRSDQESIELIQLATAHSFKDDPLKRRRYVVIHFPEFLFLLGGYDFDPINKRRLQPRNDFLYDIKTQSVRSISSFPPPGRISFGVASSKRYVVIIGGHTYDNVSLSSSLIFDIEHIEQGWKPLPSYPHPVLAPGVGMTDDRVIVIGGYDIIAGETDMISSHYQMDLNEKVWHFYGDARPARARTLVICMFRDEKLQICTAGGFTLAGNQAKVIDKVYQYDEQKNEWKKITDIPHHQMHDSITVAETKLIISEAVPENEATDSFDLPPLRIYDFETDQWTESSTTNRDA